jgi:3-hydroxy-9,10-secoandrosta-1,3,5(10)-triene-9,17-dione monooxygenase
MGGKVSEQPHVQAAIGESKAEIDLAYLLTEKLSATTFNGEKITRDDAVRSRRDFSLVMKLIKSACDRLFDLSGAHGLEESLPMQRHWRDINAISHHVQWTQPSLQMAGREALGLPPLPNDTYAIE